MLNQYLPRSILEKTFNQRQLSNLENILDVIDPGRTKRIIQDERLLGDIHHAVHLDKYENYLFRLALLRVAPPQLLKKYFTALKIRTIPNPRHPEYKRLIEKCAKLTWGHNYSTNIFVRTFDYPDYIITDKKRKEKNPQILKAPDEPLRPLLEYQSRVYFSVVKELNTPNNRFLIQMPTGTGKTRLAMELVSYYLNGNENKQVVWLANRDELLDQAFDGFREVWRHLGTRDVKIYRLWGSGDIPKIESGTSIILVGYDKFNSLRKKKKINLHPDLIIADEAHQVLAPTYSHTLFSMTESLEKGAIVIGLTATPGRGIDENQNRLLANEFAHRKFGIQIESESKRYSDDDNIYKIIDYLIMEEIIPRIEPEALYTYSEFFLSKNDEKSLNKLTGDYPEYSNEFLKKMSDDNKRNVPIVERLMQLGEQKKQVLYFGTSRDQSLLVYAVLTKMGIKAIHVDAQTNKEFRRAIVQKFREGDINILCNFNIFTTGFDARNIDVVFIGRPINSPVLYNQMVGRGMRGVKMGGKEKLTLIQVMDKISSDGFEYDAYKNYSYFTPYWKQGYD